MLAAPPVDSRIACCSAARRACIAVDVSNDQLDWKLRKDPRVTFIEKNARYLKPEDICRAQRTLARTMDVSFISVTKVLPAVVPVAAAGADFLMLIKPQFELEKSRDRQRRDREGRRAPSKSHRTRRRRRGPRLGLEIVGVKPSHIAGTEGNQEFFLHARARVE